MADRKSCGSSAKILVSGDVRGRFSALFKSVTKANKKAGPFSALLCTGRFFGDLAPTETDDELGPYLTGAKQVPVPTYFVLGSESEGSTSMVDGDMVESGGEICPGVHYLGRCGVKIIAGLRIAFLSGVHDEVVEGSHRRVV